MEWTKTGKSYRSRGVTRCTFETLAERLDFGETKDVAAQLPRERAIYFAGTERFSLDEFFKRMSEREQVSLPKSIHHGWLLEVLQEAVSSGEIRDVRAQLPEEWNGLFESESQDRLSKQQEIHLSA